MIAVSLSKDEYLVGVIFIYSSERRETREGFWKFDTK
jgi:hypothetical protein